TREGQTGTSPEKHRRRLPVPPPPLGTGTPLLGSLRGIPRTGEPGRRSSTGLVPRTAHIVLFVAHMTEQRAGDAEREMHPQIRSGRGLAQKARERGLVGLPERED